MSGIDELRQLQALDDQIEAARERIARIEADLADRSEYDSSRRERDVRAAALHTIEASQRDLELKVGSARAQRADVEQRLYGGKVGNARELDDLQRKSNELARQVAAFEEELLGIMERSEQAGTDARDADARLRQVVAERRTFETERIAERKTLVADVRSWQAAREQLRGAIEAASLRLYDRLRSTRGGQAVVEVRQQTCQGCRVTLTGALAQRLRHGDAIVTCQSCGRMLFAVH